MIEQRAALIAVVVGACVMGLKFWAFLSTGSAAIFSDALESIVNVVASAVAWWVLRVAHSPADADHPYGHGKAEFMSSALEGGMIVAAAGAILFHAAANLARPDLRAGGFVLGMTILAATMLANGLVGWWLLRLGKRHGSLTLQADGHHLLTDAITSAGGLVAVGVVRATGLLWVDSAVAVAMGLYLGWVGVRLVWRAMDGLMDRQDPADQRLLDSILSSHTGQGPGSIRICSYHKVRHRHAGRHHWVDFHIRLPAWTDVHSAHRIASDLEVEIEQALGEADATAHIEPCALADCPVCTRSRVMA